MRNGEATVHRGRFITIEGPEGSGKTTIARHLCDRLRAAGRETILTREPGGTRLGDRIRAILLDHGTDRIDPRTDAILFNAARAQLVSEVIGPALESGVVVVSARFADSTLAYQGYGAGLPLDDLRALERFATRGIAPDLTILLDVPAETGLGRKAAEQTRFELAFDVAFHRRVRKGFLALAAAEPARFAVVDASADRPSVEAAVMDIVAGRLPDLFEAAGVNRAGPRTA